VLFLDYDGVLHPDEVYLEQGRPVLYSDGELFQWTPILEELLALHPKVKIVLSTSWVRILGFGRARSKLPRSLRHRVIGATWHSSMGTVDGMSLGRTTWWDRATRYEQIRRYATRAALSDWVAVDDQVEDWAEVDRDKLVETDGRFGLSRPAARDRLAELLARVSSTPAP
jgi:hypothetical protein